MKAIVKTEAGPQNTRLIERAAPTALSHEVLVKMKCASVCGVDTLLYDGLYRGRTIRYPLVLGHEGSGEIVQLGDDVDGLAVGDRVALESMIGCGMCQMCGTGWTNLCPGLQHSGITFDGTFAEYMSIPALAVNVLPATISDEDGALLEPLSIVCHSMERLTVSNGATVAIIGPGPMGLLHLQALKSAGCGVCVVTGWCGDESRLDVAQRLGADEVVDADQADPIPIVLEYTNGLGADIVVEAGGTPEAVKHALATVRPGGQLVLIGISSVMCIDEASIVRNNVTVHGVLGSSHRHYQEAIKWLQARRISGSSIITHEFSIDDGVAGILAMKEKIAAKAIYRL